MTTIQRPTFYFGQYLGPDDLQALIDHSRGQLARHERYLHTWGIGGGLALIKTGDGESLGIKYKIVAVQAGVAVDGYGREIVVPEDQPLDISLFQRAGVFVKDAWHPVFLRASETFPPPDPFDPRACEETAPRRVNEGFEIVFDRPGAEKGDPPLAGAFDAGADPGPLAAPWPILLGFVKFDSAITQFTDFAATADGVGPTYAGVLADEVVARGGALTLRSKRAAENDAPAIVVSPADPERFFVFGKQTNGIVQELVRISSSGNIFTQGSISEKKANVMVESGTLSHGMPVPLPAGVSEKDVTDGKVRLHIHVTPHATVATLASGLVATPLECGVAADRLVTCLMNTFAPGVAGIIVIPALCDYTIIATAA